MYLNGVRPIGCVKQFHKLLRTVEFELFGFLNLELLMFEVEYSTQFHNSNLNRKLHCFG